MKLRDFDIDFIKFKNDTHSFRYELDHTFFNLKEHSLYRDCEILASCTASKTESTVQIDFALKGSVKAECERCLKDIHLPVDSSFSRVLKLTGDREKFEDENYLSVNDQVVSVYDMIYEQIVLSMPGRLICEYALEDRVCELEYNAGEEDDYTDPRWEELKKLK